MSRRRKSIGVCEDTSKSKTKSYKKLKQSSILMTLLPLAACSDNDIVTSTPPPSNNPPPADDFDESSPNVFVAKDDSDSTLSQGAATADLTVTGKGGDDTITTGSGNDIVRGGEGSDNITTGDGNDAIVVIGTTTAGQYEDADITNAGNGYDLSGLLTLADINDRTVSDISAGETINGGGGVNTLFIYGTVDLTGVMLSNVTVLEVHSTVTFTPEQLAEFTTINGDGTSTINIEIPAGSTDNYILDLSGVDMTDVAAINIDGDMTVKIDNASDLDGVGAIAAGADDELNIEINGDGTSPTTVNLGDIADKINSPVNGIVVDENVTLEITDAADITDIELSEISGSGEVDTGGDPDIDDALTDNVTVNLNNSPEASDDNATTQENETVTIDVLNNDTDADSDALTITSATVANGNGNVSIVDNKLVYDPNGAYDALNDTETETVTISYEVSDGNSGTATANATVTVTGLSTVINGTDNDDELTGNELDNTINGGIGRDTLSGLEGVDVLNGGAGNDTFIIRKGDNSENEDTFNGGSGTQDVLLISDNNDGPYNFDLTNVNASDIEHVLLEGNVNLSVSSGDVGGLNSGVDLWVIGNPDSSISTDSVWTYHGQFINVHYGMIFNHFYNATDQVHLYTSADMGSHTGFAAITDNFTEVSPNNYQAIDDTGSSFYMGESTEDITYTGKNGRDIIITGDGNDTITMASGGGVIFARGGNDTINGGDFADFISGGAGADTIDGGDHDSGYGDQVSYIDSDAAVNVNLQTGDATGGHAEGDVLTNIERLRGSNFEDVLTGDAGDNQLDGEEGIDTLNGGDGDDQFDLYQVDGSEEDIVDGGNGYDTVVLYKDIEKTTFEVSLADLDATNIEVIQSSGSVNSEGIINVETQDVKDVTDDDDLLYITGGKATTVNTTSNWTLNSTGGFNGGAYHHFENDGTSLYVSVQIGTLSGFGVSFDDFAENSTDVFDAADDDNAFISDIGNEKDLTVNGKGGDDIIIAGTGNNTINGGAGDDIIIANSGSETIDGGASTANGDWVSYENSSAAVNIDLGNNTASGGHAANDTLSGIENIIGSAQNDTITGDVNANKIEGGAGDDTLDGGAGADTISGGRGADVMIYDALDSYHGGIDGASDVLRVDGADVDIDLSAVSVEAIAAIDITGSGDNSITLTLNDLIAASEDDNQLIIDGNAGDEVSSTGQGWVQGTDQDIDGVTYNVYTSGSGTLLVDEDITQNIS